MAYSDRFAEIDTSHPLEVVEVTTNAAPYDMVAYSGSAENVIVLNKSGGTLQVEGFATAPQNIEDGEQVELTKDSVGAWYQQQGGAVTTENLYFFSSATSTNFTDFDNTEFYDFRELITNYSRLHLETQAGIVTAAATTPFGLSINKTGRFSIEVDLNIFTDVTGDDGYYTFYKNGTPTSYIYSEFTDATEYEVLNFSYLGDVVPGDVFTLENTTGDTVDITEADLRIQQLPNSSVVDPGMITPTDIGEHKFTAAADNAAGFPGSIQNITFDSYTDTVNSGSIATFDGTNIVVTAGVNDIELKALIHTDGTGGHNAITYFRDSADAIGLKFGDGAVTNGVSSRGVYGEGSDNYLATAVVRAGTTVTLNLVHNASAASQLMQTGSYIHVKEIVAQQTIVNPGGSATIQSGTTPDPGGVGADLRTVTFPTPFTTVPAVTANAVDVPELTGGMVVNIVSKSTTNFTYVIKRIPDNAPHGKWHAITWIAVE